MDNAKFFASIKVSLFAGHLTDNQVIGINAMLNAGAALPLAYLSYAMATQYHETGQSMFPNRENMNYSVAGLLSQFSRERISVANAQRLGRKPGEASLSVDRQTAIANLVYGGAWGLAHLGNTQPNDGWWFRGGGVDHCTGRGNYRKVADATGKGNALMVNPDLILDPSLACEAAVTGMVTGRYTSRKLSDYLPHDGPATLDVFTRSRPIINGTDRAADVASYAVKVQTGLIGAGYIACPT